VEQIPPDAIYLNVFLAFSTAANFMHSEMCKCQMYHLVNFEKCRYLCHQYPKQDIEHFHNPKKVFLLLFSIVSQPLLTLS
jgi:hypothetical protein